MDTFTNGDLTMKKKISALAFLLASTFAFSVFAGCSTGYYSDNGTCKECPSPQLEFTNGMTYISNADDYTKSSCDGCNFANGTTGYNICKSKGY